MKWILLTIAILASLLFPIIQSERQALFIKDEVLAKGHRAKRQTSADQMVQNILQWLQGVYTQNSRKIRQGTLREYLPPTNTQKPRPFEPVNPSGYPAAGSITPQPPFPIYTNPTTGAVTGEGYPSPSNDIAPPDATPGAPSPTTTGAPTTTFASSPSTGYPNPSTSYPNPSTGYPHPTTGYPHPTTGYPHPTTGYPNPSTNYPNPSTGYPNPSTPVPNFPTQPPSGFTTAVPTTTLKPITSAPQTHVPPTNQPEVSEHFTSPLITTQAANQPTTTTAAVFTTQATEENDVVPSEKPAEEQPSETTLAPTPDDEDLKHPPHIHAIDVQCAKDMMTINIEFNRVFNGVIYSKGFYNSPDCRYVKENSNEVKYSFTVSLNSCGTEFINAFDTQGQSYLENVLVLQNEPGIQEVWDTIRSVRCLWEGNLKDTLSVALSVGMLSQEIVTFSGDTAMAKLDIQVGKGPFAPPANGLVKIGESMTLVVSVSGDPGFDVQVKDCRATDSTGDNAVALTDDNGCVLKPKLFGAFQKTRNTGDTGASIIAYAFFNAFKFPDVMDLMIECNIELCKTDCEVCSLSDQKFEPGRRRRRREANYNATLGSGVMMGKHLRVILPQDLNDSLELVPTDELCMSMQSFVYSSALLISLLTVSCLFSGYVWLKNQRLSSKL